MASVVALYVRHPSGGSNIYFVDPASWEQIGDLILVAKARTTAMITQCADPFNQMKHCLAGLSQQWVFAPRIDFHFIRVTHIRCL